MDRRVVAAAHGAMAERRVPGLLVAVTHRGGAELWHGGGDAAGRPLTGDDLFAVASVTKLATALAVLRLVERGALGLDDPLARHLPSAAAARPGVTTRRLLAHTAGLPHDLDPALAPYRPGLSWAGLRAACLVTAPAEPPGARVVYSNVGYGLLAAVVERRHGRPFPEALHELVLGPLGVEAYLGVPDPPRPTARVAASGHDDPATEPYNSPFWRSLALPWGGLITTAAGALALVRAYRSGLLAPATAAEAVADHSGGLSGGLIGTLEWSPCPWGLGPELRGAKGPRHWAPPTAAPGSWGHAGASGCVAWCDPTADLAWFLAGTRTARSGWLLAAGPRVGAALLEAYRADAPGGS
jgi:beta-lactamase class C